MWEWKQIYLYGRRHYLFFWLSLTVVDLSSAIPVDQSGARVITGTLAREGDITKFDQESALVFQIDRVT